MHSTIRPRGGFRNRPAVLGATFALTLGTLLALPATGAQAAPEDPAAGWARCDHGRAQARVMRGADGVDPNSVTAPQARQMDRSLRQRLRQVRHHVTHAQLHTRRVTVKTYVHVITRSDGTGRVPRRQVRAQIEVLNASYAGRTSRDAQRTPFRFVLRGLDYTANDGWYDWDISGPHEDEPAAKRTLRRGGWDALNLYVASLGDDLLGYSFYPNGKHLVRDGVVLRNTTLPGGALAGFDEGDTATHEVGHWLGLLHTFENGCEKPGDLVADTPYQADGDNVFFCDESLNTCPQAGHDPVHNFMSYGDDPCLDQFTFGQSRRMVRTWFAFRAPR